MDFDEWNNSPLILAPQNKEAAHELTGLIADMLERDELTKEVREFIAHAFRGAADRTDADECGQDLLRHLGLKVRHTRTNHDWYSVGLSVWSMHRYGEEDIERPLILDKVSEYFNVSPNEALVAYSGEADHPFQSKPITCRSEATREVYYRPK